MEVVVDDIVVTAGGVTILEGVSLVAKKGRVLGVVGPNGAGKSSLLRTIYRQHRVDRGEVRLDGRPVSELSAVAAARCIAVLQQADHAPSELTVEEMVALGRLPHQGLLAVASDHDRQVVARSLERCSVAHLAPRRVASLSGGERQRVLFARALAQEPQLLILDEPSNHLDITGQLDVLRLVRSLGITAIVALHDLNLALGYCDDAVVLRRRRVVATGPVAEILTARLVGEVYGLRSCRIEHPLTGRPLLAFADPYDDPTLTEEGIDP